ncbi:carboxylating nicotinate-nucleotide diphosphorylase [Woodsholea maritima]|uniref:carboxylating nicotinate-nucleotide diphosphorylase n=1 Tax=Woodsholea maritima TaxID=240237 RepID=UPI00037C5AFE|nr:carboxylating nicotinate-nucleotide diphosphorylase [Woodsholea maritima]
MIPHLPTGLVQDTVARALAEDLGGRGDITSQATLPLDLKARYVIAARDSGVLAGCAPAREAFAQIDPSLAINWTLDDGADLTPGSPVALIEGSARSILTAERTALNFLGRMSGIASLTARYVDAIAGTKAVIAHTRKTTPTLRAFELQAVRAGGGASHRFGLDDAILIKDNHIAAVGDVSETVKRAKAFAGHMTRVAVEVDHLSQLEDALTAGADSVLLDNFSLEDLRAAVAQTAGRAILEASGGVTLDTVGAIAQTGVDVISIGALTHSAANFDLGMDAA